ncbi:hypothetical protein [Paraburkholderia sp. ZP32-5]|uniref:hypothetical protein n=1 Tax=Paraburkholderia sp. ZP32-5 TaxID=2883245 RepID=UPI001F42498F|nr:hypothetical protein [Paraburkholderia sp. ZP32-5]
MNARLECPIEPMTANRFLRWFRLTGAGAQRLAANAMQTFLPIATPFNVYRQKIPENAATGVNRTLNKRLIPQKTVLFGQKG